MPPPLDVRRGQIKPVKVGELRLRPTFTSCGVAWGTDVEVPGVRFEYRLAGAPEWRRAPDPIWFRDTCDVRGSLLYLEEDSEYEMRVVAAGGALASGRFRTWCSEVPIAKTIVIDPATAKYPMRISEKGRADGWVRYTAPSGAVLGGNDLMTGIVVLDGAEHVILDGITFVGGGGEWSEPLRIVKSRAVRVANCEFHGWGRVGPPSFDHFPNGAYGGGKFLDEKRSTPARPCLINYDAAMLVGIGASEIVIERCYAHDPRGRANSWLYSHPAGPEAVMMSSPDHSCVIRYCDFIGSDIHRFNDAVEGAGNFTAHGGFNQDADVYGNFMIYCNDDNIELDGGQQNVRCFWNRFEAAISGVSIQGCCASPVYVMDNLFSGMGDEFGSSNPSIKTATFDPWWYAPYAGIWRNIYQDPGAFCVKQGETSRWDVRDNILERNPSQNTLSRFPVRPLPFVLDTGRILVEVAGERTLSQSCDAVIAVSRSSKPIPFQVRKGFDADWFSVSPSKGEMSPNGETRLKVEFHPEKMVGRRRWRSAFIVRTGEGLSRCVSIVGERKDFQIPAQPLPPSGRALYADANMEGGVAVFTFNVKNPGRYWFFVRAQGAGREYPKPYVSIDGGEFLPSVLRLWNGYPAWAMIRPGQDSRWSGITMHFELALGSHTLRVRQSKEDGFVLLGAAVTSEPLAFEPR